MVKTLIKVVLVTFDCNPEFHWLHQIATTLRKFSDGFGFFWTQSSPHVSLSTATWSEKAQGKFKNLLSPRNIKDMVDMSLVKLPAVKLS